MFDVRRVGLRGRLVLLDGGRLGVDVLAGDGVLGQQRLVALEQQLGVGQGGLVAGELGLGLLQRHLVGPLVDHRQKLAGLDHLAFGEGDLGEVACDPGGHRGGGQGRHRAQRLVLDRHVAIDRLDHAHRGLRATAAAARSAGAAGPAAALGGAGLQRDSDDHRDHDHGDDGQDGAQSRTRAQGAAGAASRGRKQRVGGGGADGRLAHWVSRDPFATAQRCCSEPSPASPPQAGVRLHMVVQTGRKHFGPETWPW